MRTYRQLIYLVLDELKLYSDDSSFTEDHILFLLEKYRPFILKQRYSDIKKEISPENYQTICLDLYAYKGIEDIECSKDYVRSVQEIPEVLSIGYTKVHTEDYFDNKTAFISRDRFQYVGYNKYLQNIVYATRGVDNHLFIKSSNPQVYYLEKIKLTAVFSDSLQASELECNQNKECDVYDRNFPIEDALIQPLVTMVVKDLSGTLFRPKDDENNANDDLARLATFIARNAKSDLAKQITE